MKSFLITLVTFTLLAFSTSSLFAQDPPPPPPDHNSSGNVPGGGAPIGSGLLVLIALGAAYGGQKVYDISKK